MDDRSNEHSFKNVKGKKFFDYLKSKSCKKTYYTLYDYIKNVAHQVDDEQSFYVLDLADILWKMQLWREKLPDITPFYAVKANSDPVLIRLFAMLGFSFDCSTKGEINLVLKNGGNPQNIIYAHTVKPPSSLKYASNVGVDLLTFDSEEELYKIQKYFPRARLVIRIKAEAPPRSCDLSEVNSCPYDLSEKYGCSVLDTEKLLKRAKDLDLNVIGVSFHVGAICDNPSSYAETIRSCRLVFNIAQRLEFHFTILDIGAGFFGSSQREKFFDVVATEIKGAVKEHFSEKNVQVIAEPGCYFVGSAQRYVTCVLGKKSIGSSVSTMNNTHNGNVSENAQVHYFLNDGYYGSFFKHIELYDIFPKPLLESQELKKRPVHKSKLWGQTCCSEDVIQEECILPEVETGEYLVWENMGAYTQGVSSTFTIVPLPAANHIFIKNSRLQLNWIKNLEEVAEFLAKSVTLVKDENFP